MSMPGWRHVRTTLRYQMPGFAYWNWITRIEYIKISIERKNSVCCLSILILNVPTQMEFDNKYVFVFILQVDWTISYIYFFQGKAILCYRYLFLVKLHFFLKIYSQDGLLSQIVKKEKYYTARYILALICSDNEKVEQTFSTLKKKEKKKKTF